MESAPICGTAVPNTQVAIVVNGSPVGSTMSDNNGDWTFECPINNSYNMCVNTIYAQYHAYGNFLVKSPEKQVTFNRYGIRVDRINMSWHPLPSSNPYFSSFTKPSVVQFDYLTNSVKPNAYTVISGPSVVNFEVELATSDTTFIDDVIVHIETNKGNGHAVSAKYYSGKPWYASRQYDSDEYPVNVGAEVRHHAPQTLGNEGLTGRLRYWDDFLEESKSRKTTTSELCQALENAELGSEAERLAMYNLMRHVGIAQEGYLEAYERNKDKPDFNPDQLKYIPFTEGKEIIMNETVKEVSGVDVPLFEAQIPYASLLKGMDRQLLVNLVYERLETDRFPGLQVGSIENPNNNAGNWE
jgi:hypothetical protein